MPGGECARLPAAARRGVAAIHGETRAGATALTVRAGALLRELAAAGGLDRPTLVAVVRALVRAQPAMASLCRLANDVLLAADDAPRAAAIDAAVAAFLKTAEAAATRVVERAALLVPPGGVVLTLSASSLVERTLLGAHAHGRRCRILCLEARPRREGVGLATRLAAAGVPAEVWVDAAAAHCVQAADVVLVGADTVAREGLIHKVGTLGLALSARHHGVPVYALAGAEKLLPGLVAGALEQSRPRAEVARGAPRAVAVANYYFDLTPLDLLRGVVGERGILAPAAAAAAARAVRLLPPLEAELVAGGA